MYHQVPPSPLSPLSDSLNDGCERDLGHSSRSTQGLFTRLCFALCITCTGLNIVLALVQHGSADASVTSTYPPDLRYAVPRKEIHNLRRPSQFIRFDEIQRPSPPEPKQFNNYPFLLAQVDSVDIDSVFPEDPLRFMGATGTATPEDRQVRVSETVRTGQLFLTRYYNSKRFIGIDSCSI